MYNKVNDRIMIKCENMIRIKPVSDLRNEFLDIEKNINTGEPVYLTKNGYGTIRRYAVWICIQN